MGMHAALYFQTLNNLYKSNFTLMIYNLLSVSLVGLEHLETNHIKTESMCFVG